MGTALIVVDVQNDFCEGGALGIYGGAQVAANATRLLAASDYDVILASRDWHNPLPDTNGGHFASGQEPDYIDTWPVHCVAGSRGAEYHPELGLPHQTIEVFKGQGSPDYSVFQGVTYDGETPANVLLSRGVTHIDIIGLALDHCVMATALRARTALGVPVRVFMDITAGVATASSLRAVAHMSAAGVEFRLAGSEADSI